MSDSDVFDLDIAEWYLRRGGAPWGPVDPQGISDLVRAGRVTGATFVRRDDQHIWKRLDTVMPEWQEWVPADPDSSEDDVVLQVFEPRRLLAGLFQMIFALASVLALFAWKLWHVDAAEAAFVAGALLLQIFLREFIQGERIELTTRTVRLVHARGLVISIPRGEVDHVRSGHSGPFAGLTGSRVIRSRSGGGIHLNRREYGEESYRRLMGVLGLGGD